MSMHPVLIVDDEPDICDLVSMTLKRMDIASSSAHDVNKAKQLLAEQKFSLCITDMRLPDGDGLELINHIQETCPDTPVAMITAHGNMDTAIAALKSGAFDFLSKPIDLTQLRQLVELAIQLPSANASPAQEDDIARRLVGSSAAIANLKLMIKRVARSQAPVFISGESGTGKEVVARLIHDYSARKNGPFIAVNCAAIPSELMESEFFGHTKGSFTGATEDKTGLFQAAQGGTLLLDEVADLPMSMQVKLLRAIQEKAVRPVGGNQEEAVDVRLLSATHKNLPALIAEEKFRNDLFYRINVIALDVPRLQDRRGDIAELAKHILSKLATANDGPTVRLSPETLEQLEQHSFPGNVRELENILERAIALSDSAVIEPANLQISSNRGEAPSGSTATIAKNTSPQESNRGGQSLDDYLSQIEQREIMTAIESTRWNKTEAAKLLGISFRSLRYRMKKLGLDD